MGKKERKQNPLKSGGRIQRQDKQHCKGKTDGIYVTGIKCEEAERSVEENLSSLLNYRIKKD